MFLQFLNEENAHQRFLSSFIYSLDPLSSSSLIYALANAPMRCVVTMVLNVSDSSDAWPGMSLHAHVNTFSNATQSGPCTRAHVHMRLRKQVCPFKDAAHAYLCPCTQRACVQGCKVVYVRMKQLQLPACKKKLPVASAKCSWSAKISTNQLC